MGKEDTDKMNLAPIVLFTYNRPDHTQRTINALQQNIYASESDLVIYSDAPKDEKTEKGVLLTRGYIKTISGFKSLHIIEREKNMGLANSLIDGITSVVNKYGKVIVLEDDLITSPFFLKFMNEGLEKYESNDKIASIHGYVNPVKETLPQNFFLSYMSSWGWATWDRAWKLFEPNGTKLLEELQNRNLEKKLDFNNSYYFVKMLKNQIRGKNNSWAIRWYSSILLNDKLCLYPNKSLVAQIGCDGSGTHSSNDDWFDVELSDSQIEIIDIPIEESTVARKAYERFYKSVKLTYWFKIKNLTRKIYKRIFNK